MIRKLAMVAVVVTGVVMLTAGAAFAHAEIEREGEVTAQGVVHATLSVPNERSDSGTTTVQLVFPASPKLQDATAGEVAGWTATVRKNAEGDVESVTWTGGPVTGEDKAEFPITIGAVPSDVDQVDFKALQIYEDGDVVRWIEPTPAGGEEPEHPAPVLFVKGEAGGHDEGGAATTAEGSHDDSDSHDDGMSTGAIVAIVLGVIIVIALVVFFVMRSRRPKTPTS